MKYRTTEEIINTPAEQQIEDIFVDLFGEKLGGQIYKDFSTNPDTREKYQLMLSKQKSHQQEMANLQKKILQSRFLVHDFWWYSAILGVLIFIVLVIMRILALQ